MAQTKFQAGEVLPEIILPGVGGGNVTLGKPNNGHDWQMVVVYRGKHCPICVRYLEKLEALKQQFFDIGVDLLVISGDPQVKAKAQVEENNMTLPVGYDLSIADMKKLGLYISHPRSAQETDRPFPEPGIFVINQDGKVQVTDISNAPFCGRISINWSAGSTSSVIPPTIIRSVAHLTEIILRTEKQENNMDMFLRRIYLTMIGAVTALLVGTVAQAQENAVQVTDNIYRYAPGDGYTSMFIVTTDGVIAIEPVSTKHAEGMVAAIKLVTDQPIRYLLHSHNHWDHSAGGKAFRDAGAKIIAHKEAYDWMKGNPRGDMALPDESWEGKREDIKLGGTTVEMHYVGMSHGLGMTVFRIAEQKVIYIADIVTPNRVMFSIVPDFNINEWKRALREVEALDFDTAIFSHPGDENAVGSKADVVANREYIEDLQAAIVAEFKKGKGFTEIPQLVRLPKYESWAMYKEWLPLNTWRVMLDMHMGPFPWRPEPDMAK